MTRIDLDLLEDSGRGYPAVVVPPVAFFALVRAVRAACAFRDDPWTRLATPTRYELDDALAPFRKES